MAKLTPFTLGTLDAYTSTEVKRGKPTEKNPEGAVLPEMTFASLEVTPSEDGTPSFNLVTEGIYGNTHSVDGILRRREVVSVGAEILVDMLNARLKVYRQGDTEEIRTITNENYHSRAAGVTSPNKHFAKIMNASLAGKAEAAKAAFASLLEANAALETPWFVEPQAAMDAYQAYKTTRLANIGGETL